MADIRPFAALRYTKKMEDDLPKLLTPPYDVITPEMQQELYSRHPYNLVRIDLAKDEPGDDGQKNRYTRAAAALKQWQSEGVIGRDEREAFYVYEQEFDLPGKGRKRRRGFYCAVKLEELQGGGIRGHERTFEGPKADRLKLTRAAQTNMSPIFSMYDDPERVTDRLLDEATAGHTPQEAVIDDIVHRLWVIDDPKVIEALRSELSGKDLFIADGHHRYETSLLFREERRKETGRTGGGEPFDFTLMFITNMRGEGMEILPTHRVLEKAAVAGLDEKRVLDELADVFEIEPLELPQSADSAAGAITRRLEESGRSATSFALFLASGAAYLLRLRADADPAKLIAKDDIAPEVKRLDVTILHQYILRVFLGDKADTLGHDDLHYVKDAAGVIRLMRSGEGGAAFMMNPTKMEQVAEIASMGLRMPQKSTYFYPKIITGMVMRPM